MPAASEAQLERRQLRLLAELSRDDLVERHAVADVVAVGPLRMDAGQIRAAWPLVHADLLAGRRERLQLRHPGQDVEAIADTARAACSTRGIA